MSNHQKTEQRDNPIAYELKQFKESDPILSVPAGVKSWVEGTQRGALLARLAALSSYTLIHHSNRELRGWLSVHFLSTPGISIPPQAEGLMRLSGSWREVKCSIDPDMLCLKGFAFLSRGLMHQLTFGVYNRFMNPTTIAANCFFRYFKGGDIFYQELLCRWRKSKKKISSASHPHARRQKRLNRNSNCR